jgi:hypothetical protein
LRCNARVGCSSMRVVPVVGGVGIDLQRHR